MLRLGQVADELNVSKSTARRLVQRGELLGCKVGYQIRVAREDLDAYILQQREQAMQAAECPVAPAHCTHRANGEPCCFCEPSIGQQAAGLVPRQRDVA
ncbi:helix-turn-helix domain-containing protein [Micromonospora sp. HK10]|uniref:helix-turn-helix domain-containing protein n=1 Tax=Micromonospora sp. HK10 TaxID=1538294 RepID=UPI002101D1EF|nr:helix-turn-helix domain-containing protein [Micromonospora sp. HK10]